MREDVRAALELLLTPKQYRLVMGTRGRSRQQFLRLLVNAGIRQREAEYEALFDPYYAELAAELRDLEYR